MKACVWDLLTRLDPPSPLHSAWVWVCVCARSSVLLCCLWRGRQTDRLDLHIPPQLQTGCSVRKGRGLLIWFGDTFPFYFTPLSHTHTHTHTHIKTKQETHIQNRLNKRKKLCCLILLQLCSSSALPVCLLSPPYSTMWFFCCFFNPLMILFLYTLLFCLHWLWEQMYIKALPQCAVPCARLRLRPAKT